jgi:hypothetical protein
MHEDCNIGGGMSDEMGFAMAPILADAVEIRVGGVLKIERYETALP